MRNADAVGGGGLIASAIEAAREACYCQQVTGHQWLICYNHVSQSYKIQ